MRGGWVMAVTAVAPESSLDILVFQSFSDLWSHASERDLLAVTVDIPIGLPGRDGRAADREARERFKAF